MALPVGAKGQTRSGAAFRVLRQLVDDLVTTAETLPHLSEQTDDACVDESS